MKLLQDKRLVRTYVTSVKLNRCSPDVPDTCASCLEGNGTLFHRVWDCPKLQKYWKTVFFWSECATPSKTVYTRYTVYLESFIISSEQLTLIDFGLQQARMMRGLFFEKN